MSPSYTRVYPLVVARGSGAVIEDVDGNLFLDFTAGIAVTSTGHCHPHVVAAIQDQADKLMHMSGTDFYYQPQIDLAQRLAEAGTRHVAQARLLHQQRRRGAGSGPEAGPLAHRPVAGHRLLRRLPRPHLRRHVAVRLQARPPPRLLAAGARHPPRPLSARLPRLRRRRRRLRLRRSRSRRRVLQAHGPARRGGRHLRRADPGRGRLPRAAAGLPAGPAASCATGTASCWSPTRCRAAWAAPASCSPSSTGASSRTSSAWPRASPAACRWARSSPATRSWTGRSGSHASTFGGNPVSCRAALATLDLLEARLHRQRRRSAASNCGRACSSCSEATRRRATCAAWA